MYKCLLGRKMFVCAGRMSSEDWSSQEDFGRQFMFSGDWKRLKVSMNPSRSRTPRSTPSVLALPWRPRRSGSTRPTWRSSDSSIPDHCAGREEYSVIDRNVFSAGSREKLPKISVMGGYKWDRSSVNWLLIFRQPSFAILMRVSRPTVLGMYR